MASSRSGSAQAVAVSVVAAVAMLAVLPTGSAIKCFVCNSMDTEACNDLSANDTASQAFLKDCSKTSEIMPPPLNAVPAGAEPFCRKIIQTTMIDGKRRVIRRCGYEKNPKPCYHYDDSDHGEVVCQCFEDACNAATGLQRGGAAGAALAAAVAAVLLLLAR